MYELSEQDITLIAEKAATAALSRAGLVKSQVSTNEAHKRFGRKRVTDWRKRGLITPVKQGGVIYWRVEELEKASLKNLL
jgi:hypothetical protein